MNKEGYQRLCAAVIESAVDDYKAHCRAGRIVDGKPTKGRDYIRRNGARTKGDDAATTLHFFKGGCLDKWINLGALKLDAKAIRERLGIK